MRLSIGQEALYFEHQANPHSFALNESTLMRLRSELNVEALHRAIQRLVDRHENLRVNYRLTASGVEAMVHPQVRVDFQAIDASAGGETAVAAALVAIQNQRLDLERDPLFLVRLWSLSPTDHRLLFLYHHIVVDGWSHWMLLEELRMCYRAECGGEPAQLPPIEEHFENYVRAQEEFLASPRAATLASYWEKKLADAPVRLNLPTDHPRSETRDDRGDSVGVTLAPELYTALSELATSRRTSLYTLLLAAYQALLHRYTGQTDILVTSPVHGRNDKRWNSLVGYFVNQIVLRGQPTAAMSFEDFWAQLRTTVFGAYKNAAYPFPLVVRQAAQQQETRSSMAHVSFVYQKSQYRDDDLLLVYPGASTDDHVDFAGLDASALTPPQKPCQSEIGLIVAEARQSLRLQFTYQTALFEAATIRRFAAHFQEVLTAIVRDPSQGIGQLGELAGVPVIHRQELLPPRPPLPVESTIVEKVAAIRARYPDHVAIECDGMTVTYAELDVRSTQLARRLQGLGVRRDEVVGLLLERSPEAIISLLAIQKAGAAYLPLSPDYPQDRLEYLVRDAGVQVVLTAPPDRREIDSPVQWLDVTTLTEFSLPESAEAPLIDPLPAQAAYLIYTSGSTGKPKGVIVSQGNIATLAQSFALLFRLKPESRMMQFASLTFDASCAEIFPALVTGARLVIPARHQLLPGRETVDLMERSQVTHLVATPSGLSLLPPRDLPALEMIILGGEVISPALQQQWRKRCRLINGYGPTEATVAVTSSEEWEEDELPPIGREMEGTEAYVLDTSLQPVPKGVSGEIYIGGAGVARGYRNRPDFTAERFIPDGFSGRPGARLYRTGDLGRWREDDQLEFLGRIDQQVKIHGHRMEPGEIEALLLEHPAVTAAAVLARKNQRDEMELVAFVTASRPEDFRAYLAAHLPVYMVPAAIAVLDVMPLTIGGKIDRQKLQVLPVATAPTTARVPLETAMEKEIGAVWSELLQVDGVGRYDHFFALGGHSLLAIRVIGRLHESLSFEISRGLQLFLSHPVLEDFARRLESICSGEVASNRKNESIPTVENGSRYPLSFAQEQLWFVNQLDPGNTAYNIPLVLRLRGNLDADALARAVDALAQRHSSLRTCFQASDAELQQQIVDLHLPLEKIALAGETVEARLVEATAHLRAILQRPFDLRSAPLHRVMLYSLAPDDHLLLTEFHHIIADGWSFGIYQRELAALYADFAAGRESSLPSLPIQYGDFAVWQRDRLSGERLQQLNDYWLKQLAHTTPTELPWDQARPAVQTFQGATHRSRIEPALLARLKHLAREENASLYMALLAAFNVLLHRYSGQEDILVGSPHANRLRPEVEGLIGAFANVLVLRSHPTPDESYRRLLTATRDMANAAFAHQELPFEKLVNQLGLERDLSRNPLIQVVFALQNAGGNEASWPGLTAQEFDVPVDSTRVDLECHVRELDNAAEILFVYNTALFAPATIERFSRYWLTLMESIVADPDRAIGQLAMMEDAERQCVLDWSCGVKVRECAGTGQTLTALMERAVLEYPLETAVEWDGVAMSYQDLHVEANKLARHLVEVHGVKPERRVGVLMGRSLDAVMAFLAIQKAGGVYVPLDPDYPVSRLEFLIADAGLDLILTGEKSAPELTVSSRVTCLTMREARIRCADETGMPLPPRCQGDHAAYMIYTSGTTGQPKGVVIPHVGIVNTVLAMVRDCGLKPGMRFYQFCSLSFDPSLVEIAGSLASGATLVIGRKDETAPGEPLWRFLSQQRVTHLQITPSALAFVPCRKWPELRLVITGGENLPQTLALRWREHARVINAYGPTETSVCATLTDAWKSATPPIGFPLPNAQVYLLDATLQPVPAGVRGEVCVGGVGVARGYHQRPELTAERFIPDPFSTQPGARLYRTGDQGRWLADGQIEFLGRIDTQVKLRGFRIELGEIETILLEQPEVQDAAVVISANARSESLVGFIVAEDVAGKEQLPEQCLRQLRALLPAHFVPNALYLLETLPSTPNGKVDRAQLARLAATRTAVKSFSAPTTPMEQRVAAIWSEALGVERVGREDSFFALGGHSLLATRVLARLQEAMSLDVASALKNFFRYPTLSEFCAALETGVEMVDDIPCEPGRTTAPLSFAQQRLWFLHQLFPLDVSYNVPIQFRLRGAISQEALTAAVQELIDRHSILRTRFRPDGRGGAMQEISPSMRARIEMQTFAKNGFTDAGEWANHHASAFIQAPFDLEKGPLFRMQCLHLGEGEYRFVCCLHHIIFDGWSAPIFINELFDNLDLKLGLKPVTRPPLPVQYADFAAWERQPAQESRWLSALEYWRHQLRDLPALELPGDHPRQAAPSGRAGRLFFEIPAELLAKLETLTRQSEATPYMGFLAAFQFLLGRWSGQDDFSVGTAVANRNQKELQNLVGFFVNSLVLRADLRGAVSFTELLTRVRATARDAFAHQEMPFERLVEELHPSRELFNPLFQVVCVLQQPQQVHYERAHFLADWVAPEVPLARVDIELHLFAHDDGFSGGLVYDRALFEPETIEQLAAQYVRLLEKIVSDPNRPLREFDLRTEKEVRNGSPMPLAETEPASTDFTQRFSLVAAIHPDRVALEEKERCLTYAELDALTDRVAQRLQQRGVGPETIVGVMMDRSIEVVAAMLAIMKAGGAYVPLDRNYPPDRLAFIVRDIDLQYIVTEGHSLPVEGRMMEWLDWSSLAQPDGGMELDTRFAAAVLHPQQAAYLIYTSGSTGMPKGVVATQASLCASMAAQTEAYQMGPESRMLQNASLNFDASVLEIFSPLWAGARLVIPEKNARIPGPEMIRTLRRHAVTHLVITPSALVSLPEAELPELQVIVCGGEALPQSVITTWKPGRLLINGYGPTETAVCVSVASEWETNRRAPIGRPLPTTQLYLLDEELRPVPVGARGELYIGGAHVTRGYLNRPDVTAEHFIPDPFSDEPGARLYRSGDLGRWRADGQIDFLGRRDDQVKVRGFRIELGEIEAALHEHPSVKEAIVLLRDNARQEREIAAYVVAKPDGERLQSERVGAWRQLYDDVIDKTSQAADPELDIVGWNSSYDGRPLPALEMREWRDRTVAQILALQPRRVLEIGCGTGLLLLPTAPHVDAYWGVDFSAASLKRVGASVERKGWKHVHLLNRRADELEDLTAERFDLVVINSVIQYFPSNDYMLKVLERVIAMLPDGARLFLGDVRNLELLSTMQASVEWSHAADDCTREELARRVRRKVEAETELSFSPGWMLALPEQIARIRSVDLRWRRMPFANELSKFRYDAVLQIGPTTGSPVRSWETLEVVAPVTSQDLAQDLEIAAWVEDRSEWGAAARTVGEFRKLFAAHARSLQPDDLAIITGTRSHEAARELTNNPLRAHITRQAQADLRRYLEERLPAHMIPSTLCVLDHFPANRSGKVDRAMLRQIEEDRHDGTVIEPPATEMERLVAKVWSELLQIEAIGRHDNFFSLGGHSLLAMRVIGRLQDLIEVDVSTVLQSFFARPTLAEFARELEPTAQTRAVSRILPGTASGDIPLSYAQQRLWFLEKLFPGQTAYQSPFGLRMTGSIPADLVRQALQAVLDRHSALRTIFATRQGRAVQLVQENVVLPFSVESWNGQGDAQAWLQAQANVFIRKPINLECDPLIKAKWFQLREGEQVLLCSIHHIAFDGWSAPILLNEFLSNLDGLLSGSLPSRPPLAIQYSDYAAWERSPVQEARWGESAAHWREALAGCEPLRLPQEGEPAGEAGQVKIKISREVSTALRELGQRQGASLFMTLLAGFDVLLSRWSGQERFILGTGIANRHQKELQELVGFFVNSLALPADLSGQPTFNELLTRTRDTVRTAFAHQEIPFERLVQELQPERTLRNPLFQVVFLLQDAPPDRWPISHFQIEPYALEWTTTRMDLELHLSDAEEGIHGVMYYDRSLFSAGTMERVAHQLERILQQVAVAPDQPLSEIRLLDDQERQRLLQQGSQTETATNARSILEVWNETIRLHSDHVSVHCGERILTYAEFDAQANRLARLLRAKGVRPESRVALLMGRRPETIVAMIAVLKAGGAYVPLDPEHPAERLQWMIDDAAPLFVLTDGAYFEMDHLVLDWDEAMREAAALDATPLPVAARGDNLAYLIYTSGSTGLPKGVAITHGNLGHAAEALAKAYAVRPDSSVMQLATFTFDASVAELFMAFAVGARLLMPATKDELVGQSLWQLLKKEQVSHLQITPSALALLPVQPWPGLETLIVVGEAFPKELAETWRAHARLINGYGPTEGTICATCATEWMVHTPPPIGRPIERVTVYLLDNAMQPVPVGAPGEIYIGGAGVARGYWERVELTAARFVPDPFHPQEGARLYRTGDRGRWRADGQVEFLGRVDDQVKIRGQRIELGEITAALLSHSGVREAAVRVVEGEGREAILAGYVVAAEDGEALSHGHVADWQRLYDGLMTQPHAEATSTFNINGWNSLYTGGPLPAETMRVWQQSITRQILALQPRRVLEIGCGSGLMLFPVAPHCESYWGTDLSQATLQRLERVVQEQGLKQVKLWHRPADQWDDFVGTSVDTVVLNSVVQYFPTLDYLRQVLVQALRVVAPGGRIFLGDVRHLELLEALYASVELARAGENTSREELRRRVAARLEREEELAISPAFFRNLTEFSSRLTRIEIRPRGGVANELSQFRYDVVLHVDDAAEAMEPFGWSAEVEKALVRDWQTLQWIRDELIAPDARTAGEWRSRIDQLPERFTAEERSALLAEKTVEGRAFSNHPLHHRSREQLVVALRTHLRRTLPSVMVPSHLLVLDRMPLTVGGKIDLRRLPVPMTQASCADRVPVQPRHPMEDLVASAYAEVLGLERVGPTDNFFELGGHSLLAYSLMEKLRQRTGRELSLTRFFTGPTVEQVAANLLEQTREMAWSPLVPIQTSGQEPPFFCVAPILGTVFPYFELARQLGPNQPFYGLQPRGLDGKQTPHDSIEAMAREFAEAIRSVQPQGPYRIGGWSFGSPVAFETARQLEAMGQTVSVVISLDGALPTPRQIMPRSSLAKGVWWGMTALFRQTLPYLGDYLYLAAQSSRLLRPESAASRQPWSFTAWIGERLGRLAGAPVVSKQSRLLLVEQPLWRGMFAVFRANLRALRGYHPQPIHAPVILFYSEASPVGRQPLDTWRGMSPGIEEVPASGEHMTMLRSPHVEGLAKVLHQKFDAAVTVRSTTGS
ncbi:MAG: hypothetical protein B9S32_06495 [Verrucomicrobia bacterium Tous-C9LFEB]|nr:MAG: hypothetical protein B9S32_06495 [Verrucomicrobia bacterium Tous-C9LFEB]